MNYSVKNDHPDWWETRCFAAILVIAMAVPLLWPRIPPLVDLMGHMGRYRVQLDLDTSPYLSQFYDFKWRILGNLGVDLLVMPMASLFGLELAVKIIVVAIPVLSTIGVLWISREVHGRVTPTAMMALVFVYGHPFQFGFANFTLAIALTLLAFALWLRMGRINLLVWRIPVFFTIGLLIWTAHSFAWGVLGLLCFSADTVREHDTEKSWRRSLWNAAVHCLPLAPPLILMIVWRSGAQGATQDWFNWDFKWLWAEMALRDRWRVFDLLSIWLAAMAFIGLLCWRPFEFSRNLIASALLLLATFICLPRLIFGSAYADMRLIPYVFMIAFLAFRPRPSTSSGAINIVAGISLAFLTVRLTAHTASFVLYDRMHTQSLAALDHIPRGSRVLALVGREAGVPWYTNREEHLPAMAIVRREAFSNDQWVMKGAQLLSIRKNDARGFDRDPSQIVKKEGERREPWRTQEQALSRFPRQAFDYVWLISPQPFDARLLSGLRLVWSNGRDTLYGVAVSPDLSIASRETPKGITIRPTR